MRISHSSLQVLSPEFFQHFDALELDASGLGDATAALDKATARRAEKLKELEHQQAEVTRYTAFVKEQEKKIDRTQNHWFYSKTALQPGLWFNGGTEGKLERDKNSLHIVRDIQLPEAKEKVQLCQEQLPDLVRAVEEQTLQFDVAKSASSERQAMQVRATTEYPSPDLGRLQGEQALMEQKVASIQKDCQALDSIIARLLKGQELYNLATKNLEEALKHEQRYNDLKNKPIAMPTLLKQDPDFEAKMKQHERNIADREKTLAAAREAKESKPKEAQEQAKDAERMCVEALSNVPFSVRERHHTTCVSLRSNFASGANGFGGGSFEQIENVKRSQTLLTEQLSLVEHLKSRVKEEADQLDLKLSESKSSVVKENERIFNELRTRAFQSHENRIGMPATKASEQS